MWIIETRGSCKISSLRSFNRNLFLNMVPVLFVAPRIRQEWGVVWYALDDNSIFAEVTLNDAQQAARFSAWWGIRRFAG